MNREEVSEEFNNIYNFYQEQKKQFLVLKVGEKKVPTIEEKDKDIKINFYVDEDTPIFDIINYYYLENIVEGILVLGTDDISETVQNQLLKILVKLYIPVMFFKCKKDLKVRKKLNN